MKSLPAESRPARAASTEPNNAGGVGDSSGIIMLDRFVDERDISFTGRSRERFVRDARGVAEIIEEEEGNGRHAGH